MIGNLLADAVLGAVPVAGDIADVYFKAHMRNLRLLQKELGEPYIDAHPAGGSSTVQRPQPGRSRHRIR